MASSIGSSNIARLIGGYGGVSGRGSGILAGMRGEELAGQLRTKNAERDYGLRERSFGLQEQQADTQASQWEKSFGLQQQQTDTRDEQWEKQYGTQVAQYEKNFADAKKRYEALQAENEAALARSTSLAGLSQGGGSAYRGKAYGDLYGDDFKPTSDQLRGAMIGGSAGGMGGGVISRNIGSGGGGGVIGTAEPGYSRVDLSDPTKALEAARYARSMAEGQSMGAGNSGRIDRASLSSNPYYKIEQQILKSLGGGM